MCVPEPWYNHLDIRWKKQAEKRLKSSNSLSNHVVTDGESYQKTRGRKNQTVEVKLAPGVNKSYAEIIKEMKRHVNIDEVGVEVGKVFQNKEGHIQIKIKGKNENGGQALKKAIEEKLVGQVSAEIKKNSKTIVIKHT